MVRGFKVLVEKNHPSIAELYNKVSTLAAISWALYPVVFIFSEGTGDWSPNFEVSSIMLPGNYHFLMVLFVTDHAIFGTGYFVQSSIRIHSVT